MSAVAAFGALNGRTPDSQGSEPMSRNAQDWPTTVFSIIHRGLLLGQLDGTRLQCRIQVIPDGLTLKGSGSSQMAMRRNPSWDGPTNIPVLFTLRTFGAAYGA